MRKNFSIEKIQAGEFVIKKSRFRMVLQYIKHRWITDLDVREYDTQLMELSDIAKKDILWFYEGQYLYNRCLRLLGIRPRSRKEFIDFLSSKADNISVIDDILIRLDGLIDDEAFAQYLIDKERSHNPKGNIVIKRKLQEKGIDAEIISSLLHDDDEVDVFITQQYEKKRPSLIERIHRKQSANQQLEFETKMKSFLLSKGFSMSQITTLFRTLKEQNEMDI